MGGGGYVCCFSILSLPPNQLVNPPSNQVVNREVGVMQQASGSATATATATACAGLIGTAPLEEVLHTATLTPFVEHGLPVSMIVISESGAGKSKSVLRFQGDHILRTDDLTSKGLFDIMKRDRDNKTRFILIPDFNPVLSHRASVTMLLISNLLTLSSEGTVSISDGREEKELEHMPCGIITACTTAMFIRNHKRWSELGITRRFLPICYGYSLETIIEAQNHIRQGKVNGMLLHTVKVSAPRSKLKIEIPDTIALQIESLSKDLARNLSQYHSHKMENGERVTVVKQSARTIYPMSPHLTLQTLSRAHAIYREDDTVNEDDLKFLAKVIRFTDQSSRVEL
jgi:hypothetical protein